MSSRELTGEALHEQERLRHRATCGVGPTGMVVCILLGFVFVLFLAVRRRQDKQVRMGRLGNLTGLNQSCGEEEEEVEGTMAGRKDGEMSREGAAGGAVDVRSPGAQIGNGNVRGNTLRVGRVDSAVRSLNVSPGVLRSPVPRRGNMPSQGRGGRATRRFGPNGDNARAFCTQCPPPSSHSMNSFSPDSSQGSSRPG